MKYSINEHSVPLPGTDVTPDRLWCKAQVSIFIKGTVTQCQNTPQIRKYVPVCILISTLWISQNTAFKSFFHVDHILIYSSQYRRQCEVTECSEQN